MYRTLVTALLFLGSCKTTQDAPPPAPKEPQVEVMRMWNTPDGEVHTEKVRDLTLEEAREPQEIAITAAAPPAQKRPMPLPPKSPPEVERGRMVSVDWEGKGRQEGEVLDVRGNWVKMLFVKTQEGPVPNSMIGAGLVAWVDFSRVGSYVPGRMSQRKQPRKGEIQ